jgi:hypothetical protein
MQDDEPGALEHTKIRASRTIHIHIGENKFLYTNGIFLHSFAWRENMKSAGAEIVRLF